MISYQRVKPGTLVRLPGITRRKVGTMSNHHAPYVLGYTRATMAATKGCEVVRPSETALMKSELLVIANQHVAVNTFPGLVHTARHTMGVGSTRSQRTLSKVRPATGVKS
jgi:hypothetical protein